ncbi:MAG TPA: recombination-associated protein RdgC [Pseudomonas sp.]|nr:recombination-associated protein RdgC [Pseudomonas sp.]
MKIIRNAIVYKAQLPRIELLAQHLQELPFEPLGETFICRAGFIPNQVTGELVTPIEGGLSFTLRYDEKILPKGPVKAAVQSALDAEVEELGRELSKDEAEAITDRVMTDLIANALPKTTIVHAFYAEADQFLVINTTNKKLAGILVGELVKVCGSVTTTTIHISDIKGGLTARLRKYLIVDSRAFEGFTLGDSCLLKHKRNKASFDLDNLDDARKGLIEALDAEMQVERLELAHGEMSFKLTKDFHLRGLEFFGELTEDELAEREDLDAAMLWRTEASVQLLQLAAAIRALCDLLGYKEPETKPAAVEQADVLSTAAGRTAQHDADLQEAAEV